MGQVSMGGCRSYADIRTVAPQTGDKILGLSKSGDSKFAYRTASSYSLPTANLKEIKSE